MTRSKSPLPEDVAPGCISVLFEHPEYRDLFPIGDAVDLSVRAFV